MNNMNNMNNLKPLKPLKGKYDGKKCKIYYDGYARYFRLNNTRHYINASMLVTIDNEEYTYDEYAKYIILKYLF